MYIYNNTNKSPIYICNIRINTPKKRKIFTFVMRCISFLSLFSFHSLIVRFPLPGCFYSKRTSVCRLPFFTWLGNGDRQLQCNLFSFSDESVSRWIFRFHLLLPTSLFSPSASLHSTPSIHLSFLPIRPTPKVFPASFIDTLQVGQRHPSPFLYIASHPRFSPPSRIRLLPLSSRGSTIFVDSFSLDSQPTAFAYGFGRLPALLPKIRGTKHGF